MNVFFKYAFPSDPVHIRRIYKIKDVQKTYELNQAVKIRVILTIPSEIQSSFNLSNRM